MVLEAGRPRPIVREGIRLVGTEASTSQESIQDCRSRFGVLFTNISLFQIHGNGIEPAIRPPFLVAPLVTGALVPLSGTSVRPGSLSTL